jgi:hypothetical protein
MSKGDSLYSYLKYAKTSFFQKQRTWKQNRSYLGIGTSAWEEDTGKGCRKMNVVEILHTRAYKWKNETCWNYSRNGGRGIKENDGGGEFSYDIL